MNTATVWDDELFLLQVECDELDAERRARRIAQARRAARRHARMAQLQARREDRPVLARAA